MSDNRIAGLVCEGQTDVPILRAVIQAVWPEIEEVRCLQPQVDELDRAMGVAGWTQVRSWCERQAGSLGSVFEPFVGDRIDVLVVAIDMDIAIQAGIENPPVTGVGSYETTRLRQTITSWLLAPNVRRQPGLIVSTPVMAIESWIIAAYFPRVRKPEQIEQPAACLAESKKLRMSPTDGKPWKELHLYRDKFAQQVTNKLTRVRKACPEADRLARALEDRRAEVRT